MKSKSDISIDGIGFYQISPETAKGRKWIVKNVHDADSHGQAFSDDSRLVRDIADGALDAGLRVSVNGKNYLGYNAVAA